MSRIKTIPAAASYDLTQRVEKITIDYEHELIHVTYRNIEEGSAETIRLPSNVFNTIVTALNPDRLWTYIDNNS